MKHITSEERHTIAHLLSQKQSRASISKQLARSPPSIKREIVEKRERLGDLEIDLIIGKEHSGAILTINDRVSGLLIMERLKGKEAAEVTAKAIARLLPYQDQLHTTTSDNGREFAGHEEIARALKIDFYFAKPYHS